MEGKSTSMITMQRNSHSVSHSFMHQHTSWMSMSEKQNWETRPLLSPVWPPGSMVRYIGGREDSSSFILLTEKNCQSDHSRTHFWQYCNALSHTSHHNTSEWRKIHWGYCKLVCFGVASWENLLWIRITKLRESNKIVGKGKWEEKYSSPEITLKLAGLP